MSLVTRDNNSGDSLKPSASDSTCNCLHWDIPHNCPDSPSKALTKSTSSEKAYHTVVKLERYRHFPVNPLDEIIVEDCYAFDIGKRTFPEVLTLVDDIKKCVELMK